MAVDQFDGYEWMVAEEIIQLQDEYDVNAPCEGCRMVKAAHAKSFVHAERRAKIAGFLGGVATLEITEERMVADFDDAPRIPFLMMLMIGSLLCRCSTT